jgi:uncharacterized protein YrzB (UPF0473 family)
MEDRDDIITLTDDEGNETEFMVIDGTDYNNKSYLMLVEADAADDEESEAMLLRIDMDGDDEVLVTVDDEEEFNAVAALFEQQYEEDDEYEVKPSDEE